MKGSENVGETPGKVVGVLLLSGRSIDLFVDDTVIALDVLVESVEDGISCSQGGLGEELVRGSRGQGEDFRPGVNDLGRDGVVGGSLVIGAGDLVEEFTEDSSEELPWVSAIVVITLVSSVEDSRESLGVVVLVDLVAGAEELVECVDGSGDVGRVLGVEGGDVQGAEGVDDGGVFLSVGGFHHE